MGRFVVVVVAVGGVRGVGAVDATAVEAEPGLARTVALVAVVVDRVVDLGVGGNVVVRRRLDGAEVDVGAVLFADGRVPLGGVVAGEASRMDRGALGSGGSKSQ